MFKMQPFDFCFWFGTLIIFWPIYSNICFKEACWHSATFNSSLSNLFLNFSTLQKVVSFFLYILRTVVPRCWAMGFILAHNSLCQHPRLCPLPLGSRAHNLDDICFRSSFSPIPKSDHLDSQRLCIFQWLITRIDMGAISYRVNLNQ